MRSRLPFLLLTILLAVANTSFAADNRKLSAHVRDVLNRYENLFNMSRGSAASLQSERRLTAFVRIKSTKADEVWQEYGCKPYAQVGDIAIVSIPLSNLSALSEHPYVSRIEASAPASLDMDTTRIITGVDKIQQSTFSRPFGSKQPEIERDIPNATFTGSGVIVGVMDVGFDLTHPTFYDTTAARYRIGAFWDQLSKDTVGSILPVGRDFKGGDTVRAQLHSYDGLIQTHGTHTLGIAAGSGYDSPYRGIACDADICLVSNAISSDIELIDSADIDKYTSATDALGFKYIFDYADSLGKPCVASFSEGYPPYLDETDSLFTAFLDSICGPGRIIVAAAGNENYYRTYMEKPAGIASAGAYVNSEYEYALYRITTDSPIGISVHAYEDSDNPTATIHFPPDIFDLPADSVLTDVLFIGNDTCYVSTLCYPSVNNGSTVCLVYLQANRELSKLAPIAIVLDGKEAQAELFGSSTFSLKNGYGPTKWSQARYGHNIHAPGCFSPIICVGATCHRTGFTNYLGNYRNYSGGRTVGRISPYSSTGPAMNGNMKPEVVAPGDNIISSYSSFYIEANPEASDIKSDVAHFDFNGRTYAWNANTGTSMATPVVAGVIALWLQAKPNLTREEILGVMERTCRHPDPKLNYPNNQYGYGEIDAYHGLLDILSADRIEDISTHQPHAVTIRSGANSTLRLSFNDQPRRPFTVSLFSLTGQLLMRHTVEPPEGDTCTVSLPTTAHGISIVQIDSTEPGMTGSEIIKIE